MTGPLDGRVGLVAGAARRAGRGIAVELGAAAVFCERVVVEPRERAPAADETSHR